MLKKEAVIEHHGLVSVRAQSTQAWEALNMQKLLSEGW